LGLHKLSKPGQNSICSFVKTKKAGEKTSPNTKLAYTQHKIKPSNIVNRFHVFTEIHFKSWGILLFINYLIPAFFCLFYKNQIFLGLTIKIFG
jgi:hypothetical protein